MTYSKTTKADFDYFVKCGNRYQKALGLADWSVYYGHEHLKEDYANVAWNIADRVATIRLNTRWDNMRPVTKYEVAKLCLHEILHLLLAELLDAAEDRYVRQDTPAAIEHRLVRTLENILIDKIPR